MNNLFEKLATALSPAILLLTRFVLGYVMILHALMKLTGDMPLFSLMGIGGLIELVGSILIILGLFTRFAAFLLAGQMAVAYLMFHAAGGFFDPIANKGEPALLFSMAYLLLLVTGAGKLSLDAKMTK